MEEKIVAVTKKQIGDTIYIIESAISALPRRPPMIRSSALSSITQIFYKEKRHKHLIKAQFRANM